MGSHYSDDLQVAVMLRNVRLRASNHGCEQYSFQNVFFVKPQTCTLCFGE